MNCPRCGAPTQPNYIRCAHCGLMLQQPTQPPFQQPMYSNQQQPYPYQNQLAPQRKKRPLITVLSIVAGALVVLLLIVFLSSPSRNRGTDSQVSEEEYKSSCTSGYNYDDLLRNPDTFKGGHYLIEMQIAQVMNSSNKTYYRCYTQDGYNMWFGEEFYIEDGRENKETKLLEKDIIQVYGTFVGLEELKRALTGVKDEVPHIVMRYVDLSKTYSLSVKEQVVFEHEGIKITVTGGDESGFYGPQLLILIENDTDRSIVVQCWESSINGFVVNSILSEDVPSGKKVNTGIVFYSSDIASNGIEEIKVIEFYFSILDYETWEEIIATDVITINVE